MAKLLVRAEGLPPGPFDLKPGVNRIGRGADNDIQVPHRSVSTHHCELTLNPDGTLLLKDIGSTNGSFVDGKPVTEAPVKEGQAIRLGSIEIECQGEFPSKPRVRISAAIPLNATSPSGPPPVPGAPPTPPPIPDWSRPADQTPTVGEHTCLNHPNTVAQYICKKCGRAACNSCVNTQRIASTTLRFCKFCGDECYSIAERAAQAAIVEKTFFQMMRGAFAYPFQGDGLMLLIAGTIFFGIYEIMKLFFLGASIGLVMVFSGTGYLFAWMQDLITTSATGQDKPPGFPEISEFWSDVMSPSLMVTGCVIFCLGPAILWDIFSDDGGDLVSLCLTVGGGLYFPMALLAVTMHGTLFALNPVLIVVSILRVPGEYFIACVFLGIAYICDSQVERVIPIPYLGGLLSIFLSLYFLMLETRMLGLLFRCNRRKLGWGVGD